MVASPGEVPNAALPIEIWVSVAITPSGTFVSSLKREIREATAGAGLIPSCGSAACELLPSRLIINPLEAPANAPSFVTIEARGNPGRL